MFLATKGGSDSETPLTRLCEIAVTRPVGDKPNDIRQKTGIFRSDTDYVMDSKQQ